MFAVFDAKGECYALRESEERARAASSQAEAYIEEAAASGHPLSVKWVRDRLPFDVVAVTEEQVEEIRAEGVPVLDREP